MPEHRLVYGDPATVPITEDFPCSHHSVLEVVQAFEQASGQAVPYRFSPHRAGDIAQCYAKPAKALRLLGWQARHTLADMCAHSWRWQSGNPQGYR